jgi:hypothetical protein
VKKAKVKQCFENAALAAKTLPGVKIVIGRFFCMVDDDHAWNVTEDGIHFDVTAEMLRSKNMGGDIEEYYAIATLTSKQYGILLGKCSGNDLLQAIYREQDGITQGSPVTRTRQKMNKAQP